MRMVIFNTFFGPTFINVDRINYIEAYSKDKSRVYFSSEDFVEVAMDSSSVYKHIQESLEFYERSGGLLDENET